jgi:hypothetical protein
MNFTHWLLSMAFFLIENADETVKESNINQKVYMTSQLDKI